MFTLGFPVGLAGKKSACSAGDPGSILGWGDPLKKEMATHSSIFAWRIPWTEVLGTLQSMGSKRVRHDYVTKHAFMHVFTLSVMSDSLDPTDYSLPGSVVHGILQAQILEWAAISFPRGSSRPRDRTHVSFISCIGRRVLCH